MNKAKSFLKSFKAAIAGDDAEAQAQKNWRKAESGLKTHIANLEGDIISKEDAVTDAQEGLDKARIGQGKDINNRDEYVNGLFAAKNALTIAEKSLADHKAKIEFLKEEYKNLKAE